ncbi:MAG: HNH endonuclease [Helicobacteraceae bacterium]|nr:HNH endonuclease [Helicobacteraceae bacterium]
MKFLFCVFLIFCFSLDAFAARDRKARADFMLSHPCPSTGKTKGACPGYQVDHVIPLKCGGADHRSNMQWLTISDHKAKTKREAKLCRKPKSR